MKPEDIEKLRLEILKREKISNIIVVILMGAGVLIYLIINGFNFSSSFRIQPLIFIIIFTFVIGMIIKAIYIGRRKAIYTSEYKKAVVKKNLSKIFTDLKYEPLCGLSEDILDSTSMIDTGDVFSASDYFSGKYKNINVEGSDIHIEEEHTTTDSEGNTSTTYVTIFLGKWLIFDFNKIFCSNVQVVGKKFSGHMIDIFGKDKLRKVEFESDMFNKQFKVYCQNEHEAFYLLTPGLMERIEALGNKLDLKVMFCFVDNKLHVAINNSKDSFEPNYKMSMDSPEIEKLISGEIKEITDFVDELDLMNDLFRGGKNE